MIVMNELVTLSSVLRVDGDRIDGHTSLSMPFPMPAVVFAGFVVVRVSYPHKPCLVLSYRPSLFPSPGLMLLLSAMAQVILLIVHPVRGVDLLSDRIRHPNLISRCLLDVSEASEEPCKELSYS